MRPINAVSAIFLVAIFGIITLGMWSALRPTTAPDPDRRADRIQTVYDTIATGTGVRIFVDTFTGTTCYVTAYGTAAGVACVPEPTHAKQFGDWKFHCPPSFLDGGPCVEVR